MKMVKNKKLLLLIGIIIIGCTAGIIVLSKIAGKEKDTVDLYAFHSADEYRYKDIAWGASREEVESALNQTASSMEGTQNRVFMGKDILNGETAVTYLEFHGGLNEISFQFGNMDASKAEKDYSELESYILNELTKTYGDYDDKSDFLNAFGRKQRTYKWFKPDSENVDTYLYLSVMYNDESVFYINLCTGKNIFK